MNYDIIVDQIYKKIKNNLNKFDYKNIDYKNIDYKNIELEFRLGIFFPEFFMTDISYKNFNIFKKIFEKSTNNKIFTKKEFDVIDHYYGNERKSIYSNGQIEIIKKKKLLHIDYILENSPFDIRFSMAYEENISQNKFDHSQNKFDHSQNKFDHSQNKFDQNRPTYTRNKKRFSYIYKNISYDLTIIKNYYNNNNIHEKLNSTCNSTCNSNNCEFCGDKDDKCKCKFEFELEIINCENFLNEIEFKKNIHSALIKIIDVIKMCDDEKNINNQHDNKKIYKFLLNEN